MRITNNMIVGNSKANINSTKLLVDKYNTQMTTQKKISKASEDPVIAIRSLRLSTSLNHIDQYVDNNIPDAESWLDVTETALTNMKNILTDIRTQCVKGSTDTLTADDRNTILKQLSAFSGQVYSEGNADYAGRTVFTGYRTSSNLTFMKDDSEITYNIDQNMSFEDLEEHRYYSYGVDVPNVIDGTTEDCSSDVKEFGYQRLRLGYDDINGDVTLSINGTDTTFTTYEFATDFQKALSENPLGDDEVVFIRETGEFVFGAGIARDIADNSLNIDVNYTKTGFSGADARPEYYYNCTDVTNNIEYEVSEQEINYTVANNTDIVVNTQANDVLDTSIKRDVDEMITVVSAATAAHDKVDKIKAMMKEEQYADENSQAVLKTYLDAAQKEADFADDNLQKTYSQYITNFDNYLSKVNLALTNVGSTRSRLDLIQNRVENQQTTIEGLKSQNEDRDISDIIIDYYAVYNAYQSSLTAASKVEKQTLLDYI